MLIEYKPNVWALFQNKRFIARLRQDNIPEGPITIKCGFNKREGRHFYFKDHNREKQHLSFVFHHEYSLALEVIPGTFATRAVPYWKYLVEVGDELISVIEEQDNCTRSK
jgi:hypothetical protein